MNNFTDNASIWEWEKFKNKHLIPDLKIRTDLLKTECDTLQSNIDKMDLTNNAGMASIGTSMVSIETNLSLTQAAIADMQTMLSAILLKETSVITAEELKSIYKMLVSPDKENRLVAEEAISNKLKELE